MSAQQSAFAALGQPIRLGLVGGSHGFIGPVHRLAATLDRRFVLAAEIEGAAH